MKVEVQCHSSSDGSLHLRPRDGTDAGFNFLSTATIARLTYILQNVDLNFSSAGDWERQRCDTRGRRQATGCSSRGRRRPWSGRTIEQSSTPVIERTADAWTLVNHLYHSACWSLLERYKYTLDWGWTFLYLWPFQFHDGYIILLNGENKGAKGAVGAFAMRLM